MQSRLRADYVGQPPEHRQRIVHGGKPQSDVVKLIDIFNQHAPKTDPVPFFVIIGQEAVVAAAPAPRALPMHPPAQKVLPTYTMPRAIVSLILEQTNLTN